MSIFDAERQQLGITSGGQTSPSAAPAQSKSIFADERAQLFSPAANQEPTFQQEQSQLQQRFGAVPSVDVNQSPLMQQIRQTSMIQEPPAPQQTNAIDSLANELGSRPRLGTTQAPILQLPDYIVTKAQENALPDSYLGGASDAQGFTSPRANFAANNQVDTGSTMLNKVGDFVGNLGSMLVPIGGGSPIVNDASKVVNELAGTRLGQRVEQGLGNLGAEAARSVNLSPVLGGQVLQSAAKGAATGAIYGATAPFTYGSGDLSQVPGSVAGNVLGFAGGEALGPLLGAAGKSILNKLGQAPLNGEIKAFINRTQEANGNPPVPSNDRIVSETGSQGTGYGNQLADNFNKKDEYQQQYNQAIQDQYAYLKQSMKDRGGVDQGGVIKDQVTGDVIDRYGRISNNPEWLQDFHRENGRIPNNNDLMDLATRQVKEGFRTETGNAPPFKPGDMQEIEAQLRDIHDALPHVDEPTKQALQTTESTLQAERNRIKGLLPDGVHAMVGSDKQAYAGNSKPFRQAATQSERTISRTDVINNMRKNLGATIDTGRLSSKGRGVLGEYKIKPEVIRSRMAQDIQVISHELGHHLDKKFDLQDPQYQPELNNLMQATGHAVNKYTPQQLPAEGIAEYVRLRLTDPAEASRLAPNFERFFEAKLDKKTLVGLEKSQNDVNTWITQGSYEQAKGLIDFTGGEQAKKFNFDKWYTQFADDLNPLKLLEKSLKGAVGIGKDSIYKMARISRGISARAEMAVSKGIFDAAGNKISDGLAEIVAPLKEIGMKEKDFATYLAVKHAVDLKKLGKKVPFDDQQINAVLQRWDQNPVVQKAQQGVVRFNNALTDILVEAQVLSKQAVADMRQKYPNYVPFMRYFDDDAVAGFKNGGFGAAKGFANIANPIKRMSEEGSLRTIVNPVESMVKNAFLVMNAAAKNKVGLQLAELSKIEGAGAWVEHVGEGGSSPHEHIVSVYENGARNSYKVRNPDLYNAMLSLDTESTNSLMRFLGGAASMLRAGATLTPDFMVRNVLRDVVGNTVNATKYGFNPLTLFNGLFHMVNRNSKVFDQFISSGGAMGTMMSLDRDLNREALKKVFRQSIKDKTLNVVTSPKELAKFLSGYTPVKAAVHTLRKGSEISELATRVGAFNKVLKKTGSPEEAAYSARDLMDFNRAGSAIRQANRAIAFLNANIQGVDRMARAFKDNPSSFLVRAFTTLVLPAATVYYWNHNLPPEQKAVYDNIPQWQKDSFFVIGVPGTKLFLRIPKPFEAGMLFATGTERTLRWFQDHDPEAFKGYGQSAFGALTPPMLMTALTPLLEGITNYSFFRNAPIVPQGEQGLEKKDQYSISTSETSKLAGNLLSKTPFADSNFASPRIIDNTLKGYTAGLGNYAVQGSDALIKAFDGKQHTPLPAKNGDEQPFAQSFFASTAGGGQIRQDFYDRWDQLSKAKASADRNQQPFQAPDYAQMKAADSVISKIMKMYKQVQTDKTMDPQTKRGKLDQLDAQMNQFAAKGLGR